MAASLWSRPASELARLIAASQVSSEEVVAAHLARIEAVALAAAAVIERAIGPFAAPPLAPGPTRE